jgi:hypothetical protein
MWPGLYGTVVGLGKQADPTRVVRGLPHVPVDDLGERDPMRRLEVSAPNVGNRDKGGLGEISIWDPEDLRRVTLVAQVQRRPGRAEAAGPGQRA